MTWNVNTGDSATHNVDVKRQFIERQTFEVPDVLFIQEAKKKDVDSVFSYLKKKKVVHKSEYICRPHKSEVGDSCVLIRHSLANSIKKIDLPDLKRYVKMFIYLYLN